MTRLRLFLIGSAVLVLIAVTYLIVNGDRCGSAQTWVAGKGCYPPPASY